MTLKLGRNLITNHLSKIGDEQWDIYEQIFIAAIDIGDFLSAEHYLQLITTQFPGIFFETHPKFTRISSQFLMVKFRFKESLAFSWFIARGQW